MADNIFQKLARWGLYLFVFCLPLQTHYLWRAGTLNGQAWEFGHIMLYGFDLILITTIVVWHLGQRLNQVEISKFYRGSRWLLALLLITALIAFSRAYDQALALVGLLRLVVAVYLFKILANSQIKRQVLINIFIAGALVQALWGSAQFITQSSFSNKWLGVEEKLISAGGTSVIEIPVDYNNNQRTLRAYGGLSHPNILGGYLALALIITFGSIARRQVLINYFQNPHHWYEATNLFWHFSLLILSLGLACSASRSALLATGVGVLLVLVINYRQRLALLIPVILILAGLLIIIWPNQALFLSRFTRHTRLEKISQTERQAYIQDAKILLKKSPFFGIGLGNYGPAVWLSNIKPEASVYYYQPVHVTWLLMAVELGALATMLFVLFYLLLLVRSAQPRFVASYSTINLALLISLVILLSLDHYLWSHASGIYLLWLILGLVANSFQTEILANQKVKIIYP